MGNELFPEDLNLYSSIGEMYQKQNNKSEALKYYKLCKEKLEQHKDSFTKEQFEDLKKGIDYRIGLLENN